MTVNRRFALAAFLAVLGVALPLAAVAKGGAPWGFRGHRGVVLETINDAPISDVEGNRKPSDEGTWLAVGDELRASRYSEVRARLPEGRIGVSNGGVVKITQGGVQISAGFLEAVVPKGPGRLVVEVEGYEAPFVVRPGSGDGTGTFLGDGRGAVFAVVRGGSIELGTTTVEPGQMALLVAGKSSVRPAPAAVELKAACDGAHLDATAGPGVQVYVQGATKVSDGTAPLRFDVPGAPEVVVFARDVAGNVAAPRKVPCVAPPPPAPPKGPKPPAPKP